MRRPVDQPPSFEYVTPPDAAPGPPPSPARFLGLPRFAIGLAAGVLLLVLVGAAAVTVFILAAGRGTVLDRMVPAGVAGYASANLDPPADQKLDLLNLSHKLPKLSTQQDVDRSIDQALQPLGLSYAGDIKPWLGAQIAGVAGGGSKPEGVVLIDSKDDSAAQRTLNKLLAKFPQAGWHTVSHGGVTLHVGSQSNQTVVLAYFDHTLLAGSSEALADQVIDTDQGKHARLDSTAEYRTITGRLPSSRLVTVFVDGRGVSGWAQGLLKSVGGATPGGVLVPSRPIDTSGLDTTLAAFRGFGFAVAARSDGLAADIETDVDTSKLSPDQRAIYERSPAENVALRQVPASAVAVFGLTDLDLVFKTAAGQAGTSLPPQVANVAAKLSGDVALEVEPQGRDVAFGAVIGTNDAAGLRALLHDLTGSLVSLYFANSGDHMLVATTPAELSKLEATGPSNSFESAAGYRQAQSYAVSNPTSLVYVDVAGAFRAGNSLGLASNRDFQQAQTQWSALHSVLVTWGTQSARIHVLIG